MRMCSCVPAQLLIVAGSPVASSCVVWFWLLGPSLQCAQSCTLQNAPLFHVWLHLVLCAQVCDA